MKKLISFLTIFLMATNSYAAKIEIELPDDLKTKIDEAFCNSFGYKDQIEDPENSNALIPNPVSKEEFTRNMIIKYVKDVSQSIFVQQEMEKARVQIIKQHDAAFDATKIKTKNV